MYPITLTLLVLGRQPKCKRTSSLTWQAGAPTLSGTVLAVIAPSAAAGSIPSDGIDVYLSKDLLKTVQDTINTKCGSLSDPKCQQSVEQVLRSNYVDLQERQLGALVALSALVVGFISIVAPALYKDTKTIPVPIHIPAAQLSQMTAIGSATAIAVATGSDRPYVTVPQTPKVATTTGYGDILIQIGYLPY